MRRGSLASGVGMLVVFVAAGCSKGVLSGADASDGPPPPADAPSPIDAPPPIDAPTDVAPPIDVFVNPCPEDAPDDTSPCSTPNLTCGYGTIGCGQRDFLCFAFEVGAPAKWICLHNCVCAAAAE